MERMREGDQGYLVCPAFEPPPPGAPQFERRAADRVHMYHLDGRGLSRDRPGDLQAHAARLADVAARWVHARALRALLADDRLRALLFHPRRAGDKNGLEQLPGD